MTLSIYLRDYHFKLWGKGEHTRILSRTTLICGQLYPPQACTPPPYFFVHLFRHISELSACAIRRAQFLCLYGSCISIYDTTTKFLGRIMYVLVFARKKDYISVNRSPLFMYLYERRKNLEEHGASVVNSSQAFGKEGRMPVPPPSK